ncbi:MAG: TolC family protein [Candidatus Thiodiazotropha sp. DIVDIV]
MRIYRSDIRRIYLNMLALCCLSFLPITALASPSDNPAKTDVFSLNQAIDVALEKNRLRTISQQALLTAEAQYQQAASSYWPTVSLSLGFQRRDEEAIFEYPEQQFDIAPGMLPPVSIPSQEIALLGRDTSHYSLDITYPLYTGGRRESLVKQAKIGVDLATREIRRTNLQVVQDVKRYYYAAHYTQQLVTLAEDITLSFEILRDITQAFFDGGSNSVDKLDLLKSKLAYSMAQSTTAEFQSNHDAALSALGFAMGLEWHKKISLKEDPQLKILESNRLQQLVEQAMNFNPELEKLELAVEAYELKVDEAQSGYYPTLGVIGSYEGFHSDLDGGLDNETNSRSWMIGIGLKMNLFEGGRTRYKVSAAKSEKAKMTQQHLLVKDAVAMQVKNLFLKIQAAQHQIEITDRSILTSEENRNLTSRAYQSRAVDTQKVIEANLFDAMIRANHYRAMHDQALHLSEISYLLGKEAML